VAGAPPCIDHLDSSRTSEEGTCLDDEATDLHGVVGTGRGASSGRRTSAAAGAHLWTGTLTSTLTASSARDLVGGIGRRGERHHGNRLQHAAVARRRAAFPEESGDRASPSVADSPVLCTDASRSRESGAATETFFCGRATEKALVPEVAPALAPALALAPHSSSGSPQSRPPACGQGTNPGIGCPAILGCEHSPVCSKKFVSHMTVKSRNIATPNSVTLSTSTRVANST
jgi:hypothetical protein